MSELDPLSVVFSIIITWGIGLAPPLLIRYVILKRPLSKWPAIGICAAFWVSNVILFTALGSQSKSHFVLTIVAFVSYWLLRRAAHGQKSTTTQYTTTSASETSESSTASAPENTAPEPLQARPATYASSEASDEGFISDQELAIIAKHNGIKDIIVHGHGVDPILKPRFITHYLVRVNGRLLYRDAGVRPGDNLQALAGWIGLNHGPAGRGPNTNPFEFESTENIADTLGALGITKFSVDSQINWKRVNVSFDI